MGDADAERLVLLRLSGELSTKSRATRARFVRRLLRNLRDALASQGVSAQILSSHDRTFVELPGGAAESAAAVEALRRVFGVQSLSEVERRPAERLEQVVAAGVELFGERVRGRRFAVRARRVGDRSRIALRAGDVERALGAALLPAAAGVDLGDPQITVHVELIEDGAYFFPERITAQGGLPLGVEGRAVALLSGGFDSAVAAWQLLKRGVCIDYVFCNLGGEGHQRGVLRVAKLLAERWSSGDRPRLHALDFEPLAAQLQERTQMRYWQVLLKRLMLRAAERVARERGARAIVTGESVGQVSSQTLQNLAVVDEATPMVVLRPLVGFNKEEIIAVAERIGTFELSKVVAEYCAMVPRRPATAAAPQAVLAEEAKLELAAVDAAVRERGVFDLRSFDAEKLALPELEVERIPEGATLLDLRSRAEYQGWHHPDALCLDLPRALQLYPSFDRSQTYVLCCEIGLKSAHLAELMRADGFDAFHFRGGIPALRRLTQNS